MAIDFPASPAVGQRYGFGGVNYVFTAQGVWSVTSTGTPATSTSAVTVQKFTTPPGTATYTPTPGTQFVIVECLGGGGAGGGSPAATSANGNGGGGGGAGGYSRSRLTAAQIGTSQSITIGGAGGAGSVGGPGGNGGDTSFGSLCIAKGGSGGAAAPASAGGPGGAGGIAGTGDVTGVGANGDTGTGLITVSAMTARGGQGASSSLGGGGTEVTSAASTNGNTASGFGAGGGGGASFQSGAGTVGGAGSAGIVIVTEYNIAAAGPQGPVGPTGGTTGVSAPGGRLTLNATTPVMVTSNAASPAIFYVPYIGDRIPIFDGANMVMTTFPGGGSLQCLLNDTSKNPGAIGNQKCNDWYVWSDGGTIRLSHGPDWTSDTVRAPGTLVPVMVNGIWTNAASIVNGPTVNRGTYVGTTRSNATSTLDWIFGAAATNGTAGFFGVWNAYNRVEVTSSTRDTTDTWTYSTATWRPANNQNTMRCSLVRGLDEDGVFVQYNATFNANAVNGSVGVGLDTTSNFTGTTGATLGGLGGSYMSFAAVYVGLPGIGFHFFQAVEFASGASCTFAGDAGTAYVQTGLNSKFRM